jgi:hypothetical protein
MCLDVDDDASSKAPSLAEVLPLLDGINDDM